MVNLMSCLRYHNAEGYGQYITVVIMCVAAFSMWFHAANLIECWTDVVHVDSLSIPRLCGRI